MRYQLASYLLESDGGLSRQGRAIHLPPKERQLLLSLVEAEGRLVSKDELIDRVWKGGEVSDSSIFRAVYRLRQAMAGVQGEEVLGTLYGSGFRITVPIRARRAGPSSSVRSIVHTPAAGAVEAYLSAREYMGPRSPADLEAAVRALRYALECDRDYVAAWVGLAETRALQATRCLLEPREAGELAKEAAEQALARDAFCAPAYAIRGFVRAAVDFDIQTGLNDLDHAVDLDSDYWGSYFLRGWVLVGARRHDEAVAVMRQALELNPVSRTVSGLYAFSLYAAGRPDEALYWARELAKRFDNVDNAHLIASVVASLHGLHEEAIAFGRRAAQLAPETPLMHTSLAYSLAVAGRADDARAVLGQMDAIPLPRPSIYTAAVHLALGERDVAVDQVIDAYNRGLPQFALARDDPRLAPLMDDPRIAALWASIEARAGTRSPVTP